MPRQTTLLTYLNTVAGLFSKSTITKSSQRHLVFLRRP